MRTSASQLSALTAAIKALDEASLALTRLPSDAAYKRSVKEGITSLRQVLAAAATALAS